MSPIRPALLTLLVLLAPRQAAAQLGLDLGAPPKEEPKPDAKKAEPKKAPARPAPAKAAPAKPAPARPAATKPAPAAAPAPVPTPAPAPAPAAAPVQPPAARPARPAPGMGLDLGAKSEVRPRLDAARALLDARKHQEAALALHDILRDPGLAEGHDEARFLLAKALSLLGLNHAALTYLDELLQAGGGRSRFAAEAMEWVFHVGQALGSEQAVLARVARFSRAGVPEAHLDRFNFLLAKYEFERGRALDDAGQADAARSAFQEARRLAALVRQEAGAAATPTKAGAAPAVEGGDVFARAQFVDGLALYALRDEEAATERFKEVVRLTGPRKGRAGDPELRELAFLQLARIHYQHKQNRYAVFYYGKMPWGGRSWLEGLWEASYAHYRIGEHEKALGNLLTLQSAYFKDEYFPESWVLKAIIYYENCRYPEARQVIDDFNGRYERLHDELVAVTGRPTAPSAFLELSASPRILKLAYTDQNIRRLVDGAREIDVEVDRGIGRSDRAFRESPLAKVLQERLAHEKTQLVTEAGLRARGKLEYERDQLRAMLAQALRIQIEISRQEREALEGSLAAGSQVEVVKDLRWTHAVSDEHLYWPYEGEFWRDELGTYSYTLTKGCKDRPPRSSSR